MAAFTDQFQRRNPLTFNAFPLMSMWPRQIAWEARQLLAGRTCEELVDIARAVDGMIAEEAIRSIERLSDSTADADGTNPKTSSTYVDFSDAAGVGRIRLEHGDVNLLEAIEDPVWREGFAPHEAFAVLALWKIVDCYDLASSSVGSLLADILVIEGEPYQPAQLAAKGARTAKKEQNARNYAAAEAIEAMRACTIAAQFKRQDQLVQDMRGMTVDAVQARLALEASLRKQEARERAQRSADARWGKKSLDEARALEMAKARKYATRIGAARSIADDLEKDDKSFYTAETVDSWLKKAGWKPNP